MLFTVAGLKDEEDDPIVDPDVPMRDDGCEGRFAKAYIHDEIPWMDLRHEVRDLMFLSVPDIAVPTDELLFQDDDMPDDGMETCWFVEPVAEAAPAIDVPEPPTAIAASTASVMMISASEAVHMIAMPAEVPEETEPVAEERTLAISAATEMVRIHAPVAVPSLPQPVRLVEEAPAPEVPEGLVADDVPALVPTEAPDLQVSYESPKVDDIVETVEAVDIPEAEPVGEFTVTVPEIESEVPASVTEDMPAVRFSFGSQEVRGSGWRVCFSF